jgi:hypothetical protein
MRSYKELIQQNQSAPIGLVFSLPVLSLRWDISSATLPPIHIIQFTMMHGDA